LNKPFGFYSELLQKHIKKEKANMKSLKILLLSVWLIPQVNTFNNLQAQDLSNQKHVIGARGAGFFSEFLSVLGHLVWCEAAEKQPVVFWGKPFLYYEPEGWNNTKNAWEYYFDPVSTATYDSINDIVDYRFKAPNSFFFPWCDFSEIEMMRPIAYHVIEKYIKIKPFILEVVDDFYNKNMKNCIVVGIHLRGTNKGDEANTTVHPSEIIKKAQKYAYRGVASGKNVKYLIASDEQILMDFAQSELRKDHPNVVNGDVISFSAERSKGKETNYYTFVGTKKENGFFAKRGLDVLIEVLLLSRCDYFVHTRSNVSTAVIFFNPNLIHSQFDGFAKIDEVKAKAKPTKVSLAKPESTQSSAAKSIPSKK
jgi:hypothetical protein